MADAGPGAPKDVITHEFRDADEPQAAEMVRTINRRHQEMICPRRIQDGLAAVAHVTRRRKARVVFAYLRPAFVQPVGYAVFHTAYTHAPRRPSRLHCSIDAIATAPGFRRRGVARTLIAAIAGWARELRCHNMQLIVNVLHPQAVTLYLKMGFRFRRPYRIFNTQRSSEENRRILHHELREQEPCPQPMYCPL